MVRKEDDSKFNDGGYLKNRDISDDIVFSSKIRKKPKKTKGGTFGNFLSEVL